MVASRVLVPGTVQYHQWALEVSSGITRNLRNMYWPNALEITPGEVINVMRKAKVSFVLMGAYGINGWKDQPRSTQDVDVLVVKKDIKKAVRSLGKAFPNLVIKDFSVVTRFFDPHVDQPVINIMKPVFPLFKAAFRKVVWLGENHRIPNLEMALASKFAAMVSLHREFERKKEDAADFMKIVKRQKEKINIQRIKQTGDVSLPEWWI